MPRRGPLRLHLTLFSVACSRATVPSAAMVESPLQPDETSEEPGDETEDGGDELPATPSSGSVLDSLAAEGERELAMVRSTRYTHRTNVDESLGRFDYDCSGFVSYAMARVAPAAYESVHSFAAHRPLARDYVAWILSLGGASRASWAPIPMVQSLSAGDVVAWLKPASVVSRNTGHVMIVLGPPRPRSASEWVVPIIDSSAKAHGSGDARKAAHETGIGRGTIVLVVDASGSPIAYRWSEWARSPVLPTQIVFARVRAGQPAKLR